jgi:hypothetical protein
VGIPIDSVPQAEEWLRQAATDSVSPSPQFEHVVLCGPSPEIGLAEGRAIIVATVPQGNNSPYLHQSGRIYRRNGVTEGRNDNLLHFGHVLASMSLTD